MKWKEFRNTLDQDYNCDIRESKHIAGAFIIEKSQEDLICKLPIILDDNDNLEPEIIELITENLRIPKALFINPIK